MKKKLIETKYKRFAVTLILVLVQLVWLAVLLLQLYNANKYVAVAVTLLSYIFMFYILNRYDSPEIKIGWLLIILVIPVFGVLLYLLYGNDKPKAILRKRLAQSQIVFSNSITQSPSYMDELTSDCSRAAATNKYVLDYAGFPVYKKTQTKYYPSGEAMLTDMLEALNSAKKFIFIEYFILEDGFMWNSILDVLLKKAHEGVKVRIIYDDFGCIAHLPKDYYKKLESMSHNIKCLAFNPVLPLAVLSVNHRDHRKIMVIDGYIGFSGGVNLADEYINHKSPYGHWKDNGFRIIGDAVWNFTVMFCEIWNAFYKKPIEVENFRPPAEHYFDSEDDGFVQPYCDSPMDNENVAENVYIDILNRAEKYVYIYTPYLIIDNGMRSALCIAAKRGVDVRIITPHIPDKKVVFRLTRANYRPLIASGVKIYEYTPGFLHGKVWSATTPPPLSAL